MKKVKQLIVIAGVLMFSGQFGWAQSCLPEGITFNTQSQIDDFPINYPNCVEIEGEIFIQGNDITNLNGLNQLSSTGGDLTIKLCSNLSNLSGLENLNFIGGSLDVNNNELLSAINGLEELDSIAGHLVIHNNNALTHFQGLTNLKFVGQILSIHTNPVLEDLSGLENLETVDSTLYIASNAGLESIQALSNVTWARSGIVISDNPALTSLWGLNNIIETGAVYIHTNHALINLDGLNNLNKIKYSLYIQENNSLTNIEALSSLLFIHNHFEDYYGMTIGGNPSLQSLVGLENIVEIEGGIEINNNDALPNLIGFPALNILDGDLAIMENNGLFNLSGLDSLRQINGYLTVSYNSNLTNLEGLNQLESVDRSFGIIDNTALNNLSALGQLSIIGNRLNISDNPSLSDCSAYGVCNHLFYKPNDFIIQNNATGCNFVEEVEISCAGIPTFANVFMDIDGDCNLSPLDVSAPGIQVRLNGNIQVSTRSSNGDGVAKFGYLDNGPFFLHLPQFPTQHWSACQDTVWVDPDNFADTIRADLFLQPLTQCPDLFVNLQLPFRFRGCLVASDLQVKIQNVGTILAEDVLATVILPTSIFDILNTSLPVSAQNNDTLFFAIGNLAPFETTHINLVVRTRCDTFLLDQTLCIEAFATSSNACPPTQNFSEVHLYSECINDETVRFTLRNIGNASTQGMHEYVIIEDEVILMRDDFNLNPNEERIVDMPATGATYRMEATRFDNGVQTAIALENCGGLTPGLITAYWLDEGLNNYDYACAEVILAYDPNQKTAIPKGVGESHLTAANRPFQYTIEFQNTGTDTAFRVLLTDILSPHLDVNTFRPGFSSHPYSWEIRGLDTVNVLFFPIALPDSNANVAGSQGFFTFDIHQKPDLLHGTVIENTASIVFDFNPPIVTNTTFHTIGELVVNIDEPERGAKPRWKVFANPVKASATFQAIGVIAGEKRFELFDAAGRKVRAESFAGQEFLFQRAGLSGGLYFFRITDEQGKSSSGKIIIAE